MKAANIGATFLENGKMAQAALTQVVFNPITLCSSISNIALQMKLNEISKKIDKVLLCFEEEDKAKLKGGFKKLIDIMDKYEDRKDNEKLISKDIDRVYAYGDLADDIKIKYIDKISKILDNPSKWSNKKGYKDINKYYNIVIQSLAVQGLAKYMITILEGKFDDKYLQKIKKNLQNEYDEAIDVYEKCQLFIKEHIDKDWYEKLGDFIDFISEQAVIHTPWIIKPFALGIRYGHEWLKNKDKDMFLSYFDSKGKPLKLEYIDKIESISDFYNKPINLLVDKKYLYI